MSKKLIDLLLLVCSIGGSTLVASAINDNYSLVGFCLYLVASVISIKMILESNIDRTQLIVAFYYGAMNILGIWRHI